MQFSFLDKLFYIAFSFINSQYYFFTIVIFLAIMFFPNVKGIIKFSMILSFVLFAGSLAFYSSKFYEKLCKEVFDLDNTQCISYIVNKPESKDNDIFIRISRNFKTEYKNGIILGKKEPRFEIKQEFLFIEIPKDFKFKNNDLETFLNKNNKVIKDKVKDFLNFKGVG